MNMDQFGAVLVSPSFAFFAAFFRFVGLRKDNQVWYEKLMVIASKTILPFPRIKHHNAGNRNKHGKDSQRNGTYR